MCAVPKVVAGISCVGLTLLIALTGCQSTTGKTASQTMSDASISTAVQAKLTSDRLSNFSRIDVDTERGVVNLSGVVETEAQRAQASRLAKQVEGVVRVNNNLQVQHRPPAGHVSPEAKSDTMKSRHGERAVGQADQQERTLPEQGVHVIRGEVLRVEGEGEHYLVRQPDGREVRFQVDTTTMKTEKIQSGDRIEAKIDANNHAVSLLRSP